jgi:hypothetical protein
MLDLEKSITDWRKQMLAAGIKTPVPLEELENHLREEIERQMKLGLNAEQALETTVSNVGRGSELETEFQKIATPMEIQKVMKWAGVICVELALAGQLITCAPMAVHFVLAHGSRLDFITSVLPLAGWAATTALVLLIWKYNYKVLPAVQNQRQRRAIGLACYIACLLWIRFALFHLPFHITENISTVILINFVVGAEWAVIGILGGIAYGLEKAAHRQGAVAQA